MAAPVSRITLKVPIRLIWMTRAKSSSGIGPSRPTMRLAGPMPAQLMMMRATPCLSLRRRDGLGGALGIGDVAMHGKPCDLVGDGAGAFVIDVEDRHLGAGLGQHFGGRGAKPRRASGYDCGMSPNVHSQLTLRLAMISRR